MIRNRLAVIVLAFAVVTLLSCPQPEPETPQAEAAPAAMDTGPDPTVVDAAHYTTEFENDQVRILRIAYGPGEESLMHYHPDTVAVFLTDQHVAFDMPDGSTEEVQIEAGQHEYAPAGQHLPRNLGDEPLELVLVELKGGAAAAAAETGPDPTEVDADHYKTEFENDQVRVLRISYEAGHESTMHYHPDNVAVFLTDQHVQMGLPDGSSQDIHTSPGEHLFIPGGQHLPKNIGEEPFELVLVELK